ncbi:phosphoribosyltransferase [Pseudomonas syringae]|nr:phosphoribosyltransferase [Pseudomonas syringae]MCF5070645.1 phosphoribosyltransferase [Pseudomonas syringae]
MSDYFSSVPVFKDRRQAGQRLVELLRPLVHEAPLILALPRGGVPVAYEIAKALNAPLDLLMVRKIGAPGNEEFGIGAVVDGADPHCVANQALMHQLNVTPEWFEAEKQVQLKEIRRRRAVYCGEVPPIPIGGREVVVVDDGVATGSTARAALSALAKSTPARLLFVAPVGAWESLEMLRPLVDDLVCPFTPAPFHSVGEHYQEFTQTSDEEVIELLAKARREFLD